MSQHLRAVILAACVFASLVPANPAEAQQFLMMPDSNAANFRMVLFDPFNGSLVNSNYFPLNGATNSTPVHAMQVGSEIWVSEQVGDRIARYDLVGGFLGQIGGGATGGLDNIRGMELANNTVYLCNDGTGNGAPGPSLHMFNTSGGSMGFFTTPQTTGPFGILDHQGGLLASSDAANDDIHRYSYAGASMGTFHNTALSFFEQMDHATNGDILAAVFTSNLVARLDPNTGAQISTFPASGARGVWQLGNGNIMWTNSAGAHVFDMVSGSSTQVYSGGGRFLDLLTIPSPGPLALLGLAALVGRRRRRA